MGDKEFYISGEKSDQVPNHTNFGKFILDRLRVLKQDDIAMEFASTEDKLTYKEIIQTTVNISTALRNLGVEMGDVVALGTEKRKDLLPTLLAIMLTGATYTCYDLLIGVDLQHKLTVAKPKYFICTQKFWDKYKDVLQSHECINKYFTLDDGPESMTSIKKSITNDINIEDFKPIEVNGEEHTACISYSSGTTGLPKGIELTHVNCIFNSLPYDFQNMNIKTPLIFGDWHHNYELFMTYRFLISGKTLIVNTDTTMEAMMKTINKYKIDIAFLVPSLIRYLCKTEETTNYDMSSLKILYSRSLPLRSAIIQEIERKFPHLKIIQGYGMTECGEPATGFRTKQPNPGGVGVANPGVTFKVVDVTTGKLLPANQRGEIRVAGQCLMKKYIGIDPNTYLDNEGFFKTGDLGYYDDDKNIFVLDRLKELVLCDGHMVTPTDLETIIFLHPDILEVSVVGKPDPHHGEVPIAVAIKRPNSKLTADEVKDYINSKVSAEKRIQEVIFVEELPKNPNTIRGKISRRQVKELVLRKA